MREEENHKIDLGETSDKSLNPDNRDSLLSILQKKPEAGDQEKTFKLILVASPDEIREAMAFLRNEGKNNAGKSEIIGAITVSHPDEEIRAEALDFLKNILKEHVVVKNRVTGKIDYKGPREYYYDTNAIKYATGRFEDTSEAKVIRLRAIEVMEEVGDLSALLYNGIGNRAMKQRYESENNGKRCPDTYDWDEMEKIEQAALRVISKAVTEKDIMRLTCRDCEGVIDSVKRWQEGKKPRALESGLKFEPVGVKLVEAVEKLKKYQNRKSK